MEIIKGIATNVRHDFNRNGKTATFMLDGRTIEIESKDRIYIDEGDEIIIDQRIAGKDGVIRTSEYRNVTKGVTIKEGNLKYFVGGLIMAYVGFVFATSHNSGGLDRVFFGAIGLIGVAMAIAAPFVWWKTRKAFQ